MIFKDKTISLLVFIVSICVLMLMGVYGLVNALLQEELSVWRLTLAGTAFLLIFMFCFITFFFFYKGLVEEAKKRMGKQEK